jgi:hypothetical protein
MVYRETALAKLIFSETRHHCQFPFFYAPVYTILYGIDLTYVNVVTVIISIIPKHETTDFVGYKFLVVKRIV